MSTRELVLLSPFRLPTQSALFLADEDVSAFLHGYRALWHPAALFGTAGPPRPASPYDHEQPQAGFIYAVPESPPSMLPDDWDDRVRAAGAIAFRATSDAAATLENLRRALRDHSATTSEAATLIDLEPEQASSFFGIGLGFICVEALFEAMNHDNLLSTAELWAEVQAAVTGLIARDADATQKSLHAAASRLLSAREVLYPVAVHVVDLWLPDLDQPAFQWPAAIDRGVPLNMVATATQVERIIQQKPEFQQLLREKTAAELIEVCGGQSVEREDAVLSLESQLWNLTKGQEKYRDLLGKEVRVFARRRFGHHPGLPQLLESVGIDRAVLLAFDESVLPTPHSCVASWPSVDGKQVEAFCRVPLPADSAQTFFHLTNHLHRTIMHDGTATLALIHRGKPAHVCYGDWLALTYLAPALGQWDTLSSYLGAVMPGEYLSPGNPDEFHGDYLVDRTIEPSRTNDPVSGLARGTRVRRRIDTAWTLSSLYRSLGIRADASAEPIDGKLTQLEDEFESTGITPEDLELVETQAAESLTARLTARGEQGRPGFLVLNPCSFKRRVALELPGVTAQLPLDGMVKACQVDMAGAKVVVEVPALGFAWLPRDASGPAVTPRNIRLADEHVVRNEFFEAEIDPETGGLKSLRDMRTRAPRLGQQLVFNPGSTMRGREIKTNSTGPALGEIVTVGTLHDSHDEVLATFQQRFRAWMGRPVLEIQIEIVPSRPPQGYAWHAYFGSRFAWRDERAALLRGQLGTAYLTSHTRPESPDFLEIRQGRHNTVLLTGGLPFLQRHGSRMVDVILVPEGEAGTVFDLAIGLDREVPMQTALGMVTPVSVVPTDRGPPHIGASGWLFHVDAPNLVMTTIRPAPDWVDAITVRLLECGQHSGSAELRCVRNPKRALLLDARGQLIRELMVQGDAVLLDIGASELAQVRVEFS